LSITTTSTGIGDLLAGIPPQLTACRLDIAAQRPPNGGIDTEPAKFLFELFYIFPERTKASFRNGIDGNQIHVALHATQTVCQLFGIRLCPIAMLRFIVLFFMIDNLP